MVRACFCFDTLYALFTANSRNIQPISFFNSPYIGANTR